jgi:hypothetical protein
MHFFSAALAVSAFVALANAVNIRMYTSSLNCEGSNLECLDIGENQCCGDKDADYYSVNLSSTVSIDLTLRLPSRCGSDLVF